MDYEGKISHISSQLPQVNARKLDVQSALVILKILLDTSKYLNVFENIHPSVPTLLGITELERAKGLSLICKIQLYISSRIHTIQ